MGRLRGLAALLAGAVALAPAARAAEVTRVLSSGEPDSAFAFAVSLRWDRIQRRGNVTREFGSVNPGSSAGAVDDELELRYSAVTNRIVSRLAVGLWHDLELHAELPYALNDDATWRYAVVNGVPVDQIPGSGSSIAGNTLTADGTTCTTVPCPMFPVGQTLYSGGLGDIKLGLAWGILVERKDEWAPSWIVSLDVTAPTAAVYDPAAGRLTAATFFAGPNTSRGNRAPVGRGIWVYDFATALSRRIGPTDPYFRLHVAIPQRTNRTYSNCDHAAELAAIGQMTSVAPANCALPEWKTLAQAQPPWVLGGAFGVELVAWENRASRLTVDLQLGGDFVTRGRWYDELTPATGKLLANEPYLTASGQLGVHLRASRYVSLGLQGRFEHDWDHFLTGDSMGRTPPEQVPIGSAQQNPNFDFRYDLPSRRFRITDATAYSFSAVVQIGL